MSIDLVDIHALRSALGRAACPKILNWDVLPFTHPVQENPTLSCCVANTGDSGIDGITQRYHTTDYYQLANTLAASGARRAAPCYARTGNGGEGGLQFHCIRAGFASSAGSQRGANE